MTGISTTKKKRIRGCKMKVGLILNDMSANQLSYFAISHINEKIKTDNSSDFVLFFENATPSVVTPMFACMNSSEIWNFDGVLLSTTVSNTLTSIKAVTPKKKYFYVWDLEWNRANGKDFESSIGAYIDPEISLIARGHDHAKAIENYCNKKVCGIVPNFNIKQLMDIISHE